MDSVMKAEEGFPTSDFRLPTSDFRLQTSDFRAKTSYFKLQTSDLTKFELRISDFWPLRLNAACLDFWPATSHFLLPCLDFWPPISHFPLLTSDFRQSHLCSCLQWSSTLQKPVELNRGSFAVENLLSSLVRATCESSNNGLHLRLSVGSLKFSFRAWQKYCILCLLSLGRFSEGFLISISSKKNAFDRVFTLTLWLSATNPVVPGPRAVWD